MLRGAYGFHIPGAIILTKGAITAGTLDVSASNFGITLGGDWGNSGTFISRSGTVTFDGNSTITTIGDGEISEYSLSFDGENDYATSGSSLLRDSIPPITGHPNIFSF